MTAHDKDRNPRDPRDPEPARNGTPYTDPEYTDPEYTGPEYTDREYADPEFEGSEFDGPEYGGMDALMAALLDGPLPAPARQDTAFMAARSAAVADLAVLREQLTLIGDALAAPAVGPVAAGTEDDAPAGREEAAPPGQRPPGQRPEPDAGPGQTEGPRPSAAALPEAGTGAPPAPRAPLRAVPSASGGGSRTPRRPRRRPLTVALGALAAAAAVTVVVGMGWLVTQPGGASEASADKGVAADSPAEGGVAFGSPRYLACARLVAEGTVLAVDPVPGTTELERVTLDASRVYKGEGDSEIVFRRYTVGVTPLHRGDRVLIGFPARGGHPDTVITGAADIAAERARIIASLPESRTLTCG